jgi:hypothetical protein
MNVNKHELNVIAKFTKRHIQIYNELHLSSDGQIITYNLDL